MIGIKDKLTRRYVIPKKILWQTGDNVENAETLLKEKCFQATLDSSDVCKIKNKGGFLLDFGTELHGGIKILVQGCGENKNATLRLRFGESATEAMSELGENNSTNDHAVRDTQVTVAFMGSIEIGNTGFRFVRIDLTEDEAEVEIKAVNAIFVYKDLEYKGNFQCSDDLLNKIWQTGAYTLHLNVQDYLWDGIKRDRLVWVGDMHPETSTLQAVFGYDDSVEKSLDLIRDETSPEEWMNYIPTYSMWWIIIQHDWFIHNGRLEYLAEQKNYLDKLLRNIVSQINEDGTNKITKNFIDWSTKANPQAQVAGVHALLIMSLKAGKQICEILKDDELAEICNEALDKLKKHIPTPNGDKRAAALLVLSEAVDAVKTNEEILRINPSEDLSTFLGYYVLNARAKAGDIDGCLDLIREYWGGMLELGATTFWEDFNIKWLEKSRKIDDINGDGVDVHANYGGYCYKGFRHSLCHGWASGPTAWMSEYVLGIKIVEAGCNKIKIEPNLGDLEWAEGSYPTPYGIVRVSHKKLTDGKIETNVWVPEGVVVVK